jgi:hypothetical protein
MQHAGNVAGIGAKPMVGYTLRVNMLSLAVIRLRTPEQKVAGSNPARRTT